jgi:hypothetical protein
MMGDLWEVCFVCGCVFVCFRACSVLEWLVARADLCV